ncbi:hypothetical protein BKA64DRAFT_641696 [Cadophora sp. MPI-SDFR-AT-0126]|nr:hypothetical protein BKA64DRAFT_641696 [Leotiomycetes sp. MPI-SDFR-AT-0126]
MSASSAKNNTSLKRTASRSLEAPPPKRNLPWLMSEASSSTMSRRPSLDPLEVVPPLNFFTPQRMIEIVILDKQKTDLFGPPKKQIFTIHHNVLAHFSMTFRRFLRDDPSFNEMTLTSCEAVFGVLQNWFYTQDIESLSGTIKLMEYAKLWTLAKDLEIDDLTKTLLDYMVTTGPGRDNEKGNTLKDFQTVAYMGECHGLEEIAILKTLSAMNTHNVERILENMPDGMRHGFTLDMMKGCVELKGWDNGLGFDGVDNGGRRHGLRRRTGKLDDENSEALDECEIFREVVFDSGHEFVPETGSLYQDEEAQVVIDERNPFGEDDDDAEIKHIRVKNEADIDLSDFVWE